MVGHQDDDGTREAAERLQAAQATNTPCDPIRSLLSRDDVSLAYRVQSTNVERAVEAGRVRTGRKIGLTSPKVQAQLGVDSPDFGVLFDDMEVADGGFVDYGKVIRPKVEAELAFLLKADLEGPDLTIASVIDATEAVIPALEIVDSRVIDWDIRLVDTVADNASAAFYVLGTSRTHFEGQDLSGVNAILLDVNGEVVSTGVGSDCMGDPVNAVLWLARTALEFGDHLRAGDVVLSGAFGPMVDAPRGSDFRADFGELGSVSVGFR